MVHHIRTKIICTIGPSTWDKQIMTEIIKNGMTCARVNGAFADEEEILKVTSLVKSIDPKVALMIDVKGPEVRLNKFSTPIQIKPGDQVIIGNNESEKIFIANYPNLHTKIQKKQRIVVGDGDVELLVEDVKNENIICTVIFGKVLKPGKALNLPGLSYTTEVLTEKDIKNLKYAISLKWDYVSASFIQNAKAVEKIQEYTKNTHMQIIAKIEDQQGIDNIDEILECVDGIMIARGGLGVELGLEKVPIVQRYLIEKAIKFGKPVITATQMLESMTINPIPTRAEVNDVATAVILGSDAVMLSGETSAGLYPVECVKMLNKIILETENSIYYNSYFSNYSLKVEDDIEEILNKLNELQDLKNVFIYSKTLDLFIIISKQKTKANLIGIFENIDDYKKVCLLKGVIPHITENKFTEYKQIKEYTTNNLLFERDDNNHKNKFCNVLITKINNHITFEVV